MNKNSNGEIRLAESWDRIELVCRRLWEADSPAALEPQAIKTPPRTPAASTESLSCPTRRYRAGTNP
jgi:hypothetical protein